MENSNDLQNTTNVGNEVLADASSSNAVNGFLTQKECSEYVRKRKEWLGSNLVGWTEERDGRFFPCFIWD
jgi:hypothetical protein